MIETFTKISTTLFGLALVTGASLAIGSSVAYAAEPVAQPVFTVKTSTDYHVRASATEFTKGNYARSIAHSQSAIKAKLSPRRTAIAQSNLCAALAKTGDMQAAAKACDAALDLRPNYAPALSNKSALTIMVAQK